MKTRTNPAENQTPPRSIDRWRWMAVATAASATASQAAIVQINLLDNQLSHGGNTLNADLTGNGQTDATISGATVHNGAGANSKITTSTVAVNIDMKKIKDLEDFQRFTTPMGSPQGTINVSYKASIGTKTKHESADGGIQSFFGLIPVTFTDSKFNAGAPTNALLEVDSGNGTIKLTRAIFDDANPTSTLTGVVAGGTNTSIGSTEEAFFARTKNDFTGDGSPDLLFQNVSNGKLAIWSLNGTAILSEQVFATESNLDWQIVGSGAFNSSGYNDLLWQNTSTGQVAVWFMNGTTILSRQLIATQPNTQWKIVGTGDFNGDGKPDILWQNSTTGEVGVWFMNGTTVLSEQIIAKQINANLKIVATGHFNNDSNSDILCQNTSTGQVVVWIMNGTTHFASQVIATQPNTDWKIVGADDLNGAGYPDILWQNSSTGEVAVWFTAELYFSQVNDAYLVSIISNKVIAPTANTAWQIRNR